MALSRSRVLDKQKANAPRLVTPRARVRAMRSSLRSEAFGEYALCEMALDVEGVVNSGVGRKKSLSRSETLKSLHLALSSTRRLMRILGAIVRPPICLMSAFDAELPHRRGITGQLVGRHRCGDEAVFLQKVAHEYSARPAYFALTELGRRELRPRVSSRKLWRVRVQRLRWRMTISFARHQFPPAIIRHAVWLYVGDVRPNARGPSGRARLER
jgi:hypothetical protein